MVQETAREVRVWVCDYTDCECGGEFAVMSYQDLVDVGLPICSCGEEMVQLSGIGHEVESDGIELEIDAEKILRSYNGECPDCLLEIPRDVCVGEVCSNCGHTFVLPEEAL